MDQPLSQKDLYKLAQKEGLFLPENTPGPKIIELIEAHRRGKDVPTHEMTYPLLTMRSVMSQWVQDHFNKIRAQHEGFPDCVICPAGRMALCFLYNRKQVERGGRISQNNPWLLKEEM